MSGITLQPQDIVDEFQRLFPLEFRVALLTITNRRQADTIQVQDDRLRVQETQLRQFQGQSEGEFWNHDPDRDTPNE